MSVHVRAVTTRREARRWARLPERLHTNKPGYVPALHAETEKAMDPRRNPFHRHAHITHLLAVRDGVDVGRVSTTVHPEYNERHAASAGFFGFLDAVDDHEVYVALMDAAATEVARHGVSTLTGPYNYWSGDQFGVLLEGHNRPTALFQTWNSAEVPGRLVGCGFVPRGEMRAYEVEPAGRRAARAELLDRADRISRDLSLSSRPMRRRSFDRDAALIRDMFASSFASSDEVLPYPDDVFADMFGQLRPFLDLDLVRFVERNGEPVGFSLTVPDLNELLAVWRGRLTPIELVRLRGRLARVSGVVVLLLGAVPGSPMGVAPVLFADTLRAVEQKGYGSVHTTWVHGSNSAMHGLMSRFAAVGSSRRWALYDRPLSRDAVA